jgi:transcriptional regulator with XRE-family HTH domain
MSTARELLRAQRDAGKTITQIAEEVGYSRTAMSLYLNGRYERDSSQLETAVLRIYDRRLCPHLGEEVEPEVCVRKALAPKPFGGSARLAWWQTCQQCPHRPEESR